mmetsp:Transcript_65483/g.153208  ORF Transcript_65483/g.153208 Transcript_65483/m.153208 type:complete len:250 (-) Transcript_65483:205-954(-)
MMSIAQTRSSSESSMFSAAQCNVLSAIMTPAFMTNVVARSRWPTQRSIWRYTVSAGIAAGGAGSCETSCPAFLNHFRAASCAASFASSILAFSRFTVSSGFLGQLRSADMAVPANTSTLPMKPLIFAAQFAGTFNDPEHVDTEDEAAPRPSAVFTSAPMMVIAHTCRSSFVTGRLFTLLMRPKSQLIVIAVMELPSSSTRPTACATSTTHSTLPAALLTWPSSTSGSSLECPNSTSRDRNPSGRSPSRK